MKDRLIWILGVCAMLLLGACGDDNANGGGETGGATGAVTDTTGGGADIGLDVVDAGPTPTDEGTPPTDEGPPPTDEGPPPIDEGPPPIDEGPPPIDEGPPTDEGPPPTDDGPPPTDEGPPPPDEGPPPPDEGPPPPDEGPPPPDEGGSPDCVVHADCDDEDPCTADACTDGVCGNAAVGCDDGDECTTDSCEPLIGCVHAFEGGAGCVASTELFSASFDDGTTYGMVVADLAMNVEEGEPVVWVPDPTKTFAGAGALYFGLTGPYHYDNGKVVASSVTTPTITMPANQECFARFQVWLDVEAGADWDVLTVSVTAGDKTIPVWAKNDDNVAMQEWQMVEVDLTAFAGQAVTLSITFNSVDATFNATTGVFLDSVLVGALLTPKGCAGDADCDDGLACTEEVCDSGTCSYTVSDSCCVTAADCFDSDSCTIDLCTAGICENIPVAEPACCNVDSDCDDSNECTNDGCQANNLCTNEVDLDKPGCCLKKSDCNDGDSCTIDSCKDFVCQNINTCCQSDAECDDGDDVCTTDTCVGGACKYSYKPIAGCCEPLLHEDDMEGGADNWTFSGGSGACQWSLISTGQSKSAPTALYYGNPSAMNYDCGGPHSGTALSEEITVPDKDQLSLELDVWYHTESGTSYDKISVNVVDGGQKTTVLSKGQMGSMQTWNHMKTSLNNWKGKTIRIELHFDTVDGVFNSTEGVYFDNVNVTDPCE